MSEFIRIALVWILMGTIVFEEVITGDWGWDSLAVLLLYDFYLVATS